MRLDCCARFGVHFRPLPGLRLGVTMSEAAEWHRMLAAPSPPGNSKAFSVLSK